MLRRGFLWFVPAGFLAGCTTGPAGNLGIPVNIVLPSEVTQIISDANVIIAKVKKFLDKNPNLSGLVASAEDYVGKLKSGNVDFKSTVAALASVLGYLGVFLPPPYDIAVSVLVAVANAYVKGTKTTLTARVGMTPEQARILLNS